MENVNPNIHFIQSHTIEECESNVNVWINSLPYLCTIININVLPLIIDGKILYLGVVTFTGQPAYSNKGG